MKITKCENCGYSPKKDDSYLYRCYLCGKYLCKYCRIYIYGPGVKVRCIEYCNMIPDIEMLFKVLENYNEKDM